jgi:hypothetical protein
MKLRHAAALSLLVALVGCASTGKTGLSDGRWFLMIPRLSSDGNFDPSEPLSRWHSVGIFPTEIDCTISLKNRQLAQAHEASALTVSTANRVNKMLLNGQCVSADDPRFKGTRPSGPI